MARDNRLDTLKGFLIILVIMGHIIQTIDPGDFINHGVMGLIYIFHMPLFILISGYLTHSPEQEPPRVMWRRILDIFVTLITFHVISVLWVVIDHGDYVRAAIAFPFGILWYLLSLIYWRIMLYYSPRWLRNRPVVYLAIALLVSVVVGFFVTTPLSHLWFPVAAIASVFVSPQTVQVKVRTPSSPQVACLVSLPSSHL
jgi:fucose 4-O-acetylase-like acetyltransferase